jgi:hypothetical protein
MNQYKLLIRYHYKSHSQQSNEKAFRFKINISGGADRLLRETDIWMRAIN